VTEPWYKTPLGRATLAAQPKKVAKRAFSGAQATNLTWSWVTQPTHLNTELQKGLRVLRSRSRDLEQNNDYARKFLGMVETNVVGHSGFSLFIEPKRQDGTVDTFDAGRLESAFWRWAEDCEVTGLSLTEVQRLFIRTVARDGDVAVRFVNDGPFGLRLQMIDPQRIDDQYNDEIEGRKIRMGVEYDAMGAAVAYYLSDYDSADPRQGETYRKRTRIPADQMRLYFPRMSIGQLRGVPFMASAMLRMQMLGGYEEAAVVAARVGAAKLGAIKTEDGDISGMGDAQDGAGNPVLDVGEPGSFFNLPPGSSLESWDPDYPHAQYDSFVRACLRGISSGLGVSYATLANDLENVNYSSIRAGVLEEREVWKALQGWMVDAFLKPMYTRWLRFALVSGELDPLPASKFDKFNAARWQGRRWDWVDPRNDMEANILAVKHGLKSRREIVAEQGRDLADVWSDLQQEQKDSVALGIKLADLAEPQKPEPAPAA
jgi:lambda family phage portal protein